MIGVSRLEGCPDQRGVLIRRGYYFKGVLIEGRPD